MPQGHQNRLHYRGHPPEGTQIEIKKESSKTEGQKATPIKTTNQKPHHIAIKIYLGHMQKKIKNQQKKSKKHKIKKNYKTTQNTLHAQPHLFMYSQTPLSANGFISIMFSQI